MHSIPAAIGTHLLPIAPPPENTRRISGSQADIVACEQWKAREREAQHRRDAEAQQERDRIDRAQALERQQAAPQRDYDARSELARTNPCAAAAQQAARTPSDLQEMPRTARGSDATRRDKGRDAVHA